MHKWAKSIMECVKSKIDAMGMDNLDGNQVEELKAWVCVAKDIAEYDYYYHITEAMEKPENQYGVNYDENGKYYTGQPRNSMGQYTRGFDESYDPQMMYRDMDRMSGRMYYTTSDMGSGRGASNAVYTSTRGYSDSKYDMARRGYEESKTMHPSDDTKNMEKMQEIFDVLKKDMKDLKHDMSSTEKSFARTEFTNMANMMV